MNPHAGPGSFPSTRWTLIRSAQASPEARRAALAELMRSYWRPLYLFFRCQGLDVTAAQDAVQELLIQLLERDVIGKVTPEKGRLRSYLKTMAHHYLINAHEKRRAQKRGGDAPTVAFDVELAERLVQEGASPDAAFEQEWASSVMARALERLEAEHRSGARAGPWEAIEQFFRPVAPPSYREIAAAHGIPVSQLKSLLHRARARFRELVKEEIIDTVGSPGDAEAELAELLRALSP